ncbi:MAG: hypothetical protein NT178_00540 [Proteobacteria bacterium]|nr:hypothetical protein [Pseudomonadota bacterium]
MHILNNNLQKEGHPQILQLLKDIESSCASKYVYAINVGEIIFKGAEYKPQYSNSNEDYFILASSVEHKTTIATSDPEFKKIGHLINTIWI